MTQMAQRKDLDPNADKRLKRLAVALAVIISAILVLIKAFAWFDTGSVSILGALVDSFIDVAASLVNMWAIFYALKPADYEHRFGHGKAEALAGLLQSIFVGGSAVYLCVEVAKRLFNPQPIVNADFGIIVIIISMVLTLVLVIFQRYVIRRTSSVAISADSMHYTSDLMVNLGVIATLLLASQMDVHILDPIIALAITAYVIYTGWKILKRSFDLLMDHEFRPHDRTAIINLAMKHPEVVAVHELRTRSSGILSFVQLHLEMDGTHTLFRAHQIADEVEAEIIKHYPETDVIIHQDPAGLNESH